MTDQPDTNAKAESSLEQTVFRRPEASAEATVVAPRNSLLRPHVVVSCGHYTSIGQKRKQNQDSLLTMQAVKINLSDPFPLGLYVVADGMGGQAAGEVASGLVVSTIAHYAQSELFKKFVEENIEGSYIEDWLKRSIEAANLAVVNGRAARENDMGSTIVAAVVLDTSVYIAHVGDSRAYRVDYDGELERLTLDHSLVEQLVIAKHITATEARTHKRRNIVYRTMGEKENVEIDVRRFDLQVGDRIMLCSDGLNSMIEDTTIAAVVHESASLMDAARRLVDAADQAGGEDNISTVVIEIAAL